MTDPTGYPQLTESEQRKRKQTLERAKANYVRLVLSYLTLPLILDMCSAAIRPTSLASAVCKVES